REVRALHDRAVHRRDRIPDIAIELANRGLVERECAGVGAGQQRAAVILQGHCPLLIPRPRPGGQQSMIYGRRPFGRYDTVHTGSMRSTAAFARSVPRSRMVRPPSSVLTMPLWLQAASCLLIASRETPSICANSVWEKRRPSLATLPSISPC